MPSKPLSPVERWKPEAAKLPSDELKIAVPLHVLFGEAVDVAKFYDKYFTAAEGRPGLVSVVDASRNLTKKTGDDLLSLREAAQQANTEYLLAVAPGAAAPMERAAFVLNEMTATLEWLFDDGVEDERDAQLASIKKAHADTPESHDAWAAELTDHAALAQQYRKEMDGLGGFDVALIDEAKSLAAALRDRPAIPAGTSEKAAIARALRSRLATLLSNRLQVVRAAARFVFRQHPAIVREATSAYERRRRTAARRNAEKAAGASAQKPA